MGREQERTEAAFLRGEVGVDGVATGREERDEAEVECERAREQLLRGRTWLGREFLTWMLWRSESGDPLAEWESAGVVVLFTGRLVLRGIAGDVIELSARGALVGYAEQVRRALDAGLLVHGARLRLTHGEKVYEATVDAEFLDVRAAKLPEVLKEAEDDQTLERLYLTEQLSGMLDALLAAFIRVRTSASWMREIVPAMRRWMSADSGVAAIASR
ncbi:MAG: hypothetical protein A2V77_24055 [Anaeromyxobacter sp. RBG_16_69_14]|nr:MAG: hypothetical protein A2V77_24055 [Anaeromyxobacter sp. RBG_16_69_14]